MELRNNIIPERMEEFTETLSCDGGGAAYSPDQWGDMYSYVRAARDAGSTMLPGWLIDGTRSEHDGTLRAVRGSALGQAVVALQQHSGRPDHLRPTYACPPPSVANVYGRGDWAALCAHPVVCSFVALPAAPGR